MQTAPTSDRKSGVELMRIICMLLIVIYHYSVHGGYGDITYDMLRPNIVFLQCIGLFGRLACCAFAIASGYFLVTAKKEGYYAKIVPLVAEMLFYSVVIWLFVRQHGLIVLTASDAADAFFPVIGGNWYMVGYLMLYLIAPYLSLFAKSLSAEQYKTFLMIVLLLWSVIPTFTLRVWKFSEPDFFVVMFFIGAYIRLHGEAHQTYPNGRNLLFFFICAALIVGSLLCFDAAGYYLKSDFLVAHANYFHEINSVLSVAGALFLFLFFLRLDFCNAAVNYVARSVPGIYLIHDNALLRVYVWWVFSPNPDYAARPYLHAPCKTLAVFLCCLLIDVFRRLTIGRLFDTWWKRWYTERRGHNRISSQR